MVWKKAALKGQVDVFKEILQFEDFYKEDYLVSFAAARGHLDLIKLLVDSGFKLGRLVPIAAMKGQKLEVLKFLERQGCDLGDCLSVAAQMGCLPILNWLREIGCRLTLKDAQDAARNNQFEVLEWMLSCSDCPAELLALGDQVKLAKTEPEKAHVILVLGFDNDLDEMADEAIWAYGLETLKWIKSKGGKFDDPEICKAAASQQKLDILMWLREINCPWDEETCEKAASHGYFDVIQWAIENGCPFNSAAAVEAAKAGDLKILQFLLKHGCKMSPQISAALASQGFESELFQFAIWNGGIFDSDCVASFAGIGDIKGLEWCRKRHIPMNPLSFIGAIRSSQLHVLNWAYEQGIDLSQVVGRHECCKSAAFRLLLQEHV
jgi:hypothetical protein